MSETTELAPAETTPAAADEKPGRRIWPLLAWGAVAAVIVTAGTVAALGTAGALVAGGCTAGAVAGGAVLWRLPQLRRHFARPRGASRMRSVQSRTRRMTLGGGGRKGKLMGGLGAGRKGGALAGGKGRKGKRLALGGGRARGRSPLSPGSGRSGKGRAGGKSLPGKARRAGGRLLPGKAGRKAGAGRGGSGAKPRGGPVRRAVRRLLPGAGKRAAARSGAGKGASEAKSGKKASAPRRAARAAGTAALVPLAGGKKLRAWIRKRRGKNAPPPAEDKPPVKTPDPPPPEQPPARQPGLPLKPDTADHPRQRKHPVSNQLQDTAEAIHQGIGSFEPENVDDLGAFLQGLPAVYEALTSGLSRLADRFGDEYPLHPAVVEHIRELGSAAAGQHEYAAEAHHIFTTSHQDDLERLDNPRTGEEFMDVSNQ